MMDTSKQIEKSHKFGHWALAGITANFIFLILLMVIGIAVASQMTLGVTSSLKDWLGFITTSFGLLAIPTGVSTLLNWIYMRKPREPVTLTLYKIPETFLDRITCVIGGAVFLSILPFFAAAVARFVMWGVFALAPCSNC